MTKKRKRSQLEGNNSGLKDKAQVHHKTLSAYHAFLYPLATYLSIALGFPVDYLVRPSDSEDYKQLISSSIIAPPIPPKRRDQPIADISIRSNQAETLDRIVNAIFSAQTPPDRKWKMKNCLTLGYVSHDRSHPTNRHRPAVEHQWLNCSIAELRGWEWKLLHSRIGTQQFVELLIHNSIYLATGPDQNKCYVQLSGEPLCDLKLVDPNQTPAVSRSIPTVTKGTSLAIKNKSVNTKPLSILLPRNKIFYAQTKLQDGRAAFKLGLPRHHILNALTSRARGLPTDAHCRMLLKHVFPLQFGLKNVFNRPVSPFENKTKNIVSLNSGNRKRDIKAKEMQGERTKVPKRLRGEILGLMRELLVRYRRTEIESLAGHYLRLDEESTLRSQTDASVVSKVDNDSSMLLTQPPPDDISFECESLHFSQPTEGEKKPDSLASAIPYGQVNRFLVRVLRDLLPDSLLGSDANFRALVKHLHRFVRAKQHDVLSLHEMLQGLRVNDMGWLAAGSPACRVPQAESLKRREILSELVYWIFDGLVIPLLQAACYVTETAVTKYATVYFPRPLWDKLTKPHFEHLGETLMERVPEHAVEVAKNGLLGVSNVRLVPKATGFRPVANMGRVRRKTTADGVRALTSANDELTGVYRVLTLHKNQRRHLLPSTLFGTNEIFPRLQAFKQSLIKAHGRVPHLHFVKMDIRAAFDTIDQGMMMNVLQELFEPNHDYTVARYAQVLPPSGEAFRSNATKLFKQRARTADDTALFRHHAVGTASAMRNAVFVDLVRNDMQTRQACLELLSEHVQSNMVQVRGNVLRQKRGIPQGSKVSSLLCSLLYAHLENKHLDWTRQDGSLLLRYIDDYLFITDDVRKARHFVNRMNEGFPEYGAFVARDKTLVTFEDQEGNLSAQICNVGRDGRRLFPYCGFAIDTETLALRADHGRIAVSNVDHSFSLRFAKQRGHSFLGWFSRQLENRNHVAYLDVRHNGQDTVQHNVIVNFCITAMKVPHYFRTWGILSERQAQTIFDALMAAIFYTHVAGCSRVHHANVSGGLGSSVPKQTFTFLALSALHRVLSQKAARFATLLQLIQRELGQRSFRGFNGKYQPKINSVWDLVKNTNF